MVHASEIVYGMHAVRHALSQAPENILEMWVQDSKKSSTRVNQLVELVPGVAVQFVPKSTLDRLAEYGRHQGVVIRQRQVQPSAGMDLEDLLVDAYKHNTLFLVLDGIQDPQNLGACLRTADAAGVKAVILPKDRAASVTPAVRKVASGATENLTVIEVTNLARALRQIKEAGVWVLGTSDGAQISLYDADLNRSIALVMGGEGRGLRSNISEHCDLLVSLPMEGAVESLNVSVATGICLYEARRQQRRDV